MTAKNAKVTRTCREFMMEQSYKDSLSNINCATCVKYERETQRCKDEAGVVQRYEDSRAFDISDLAMRTNKAVYLG